MAKNRYEVVFILTPVLNEDQNDEAVKEFKDFLKEQDATVHHEEKWGLKKLAYPIQKKSTGFYHLLEFEGDGNKIIDPFERMMRRDARVIRFLTVKMDKHHIEYAENRRQRMQQKKDSGDKEKVAR